VGKRTVLVGDSTLFVPDGVGDTEVGITASIYEDVRELTKTKSDMPRLHFYVVLLQSALRLTGIAVSEMEESVMLLRQHGFDMGGVHDEHVLA
jgi:hypothetical protein